jgi:hypothetical protein
LIFDHLNTVRTLDEYVNGVGLKKDMQDLSKHLQQDLTRSVLHPAGWEDLKAAEGSLYSSPKSKWRWVVRGDVIAIEIYLAWPVQDVCEPYVNLYVPANWKKRSQFIAKVKAPAGFEHARQYSEGELADGTSVFKYVPYKSCVGAKGQFDSLGFIDAFRDATRTLVDMEKSIDKVLKDMA